MQLVGGFTSSLQLKKRIMNFRFHQLEMCLEEKNNFLSFYTVEENKSSLPERMKECDFIETLNIIGDENCILEDISLIKELPNIKTLSFQQIKTIKNFESISHLPNLKKLSIQNSFFDLDIIEKLPLLDELNLKNYSEPFINIDCKKISTQTNLNQLSLQCADYHNEEDLLNLTNLTSLNLRCNIPPANGKTLNFLKQFPKLKDLVIQVLLYSGYSNVDALLKIETLKNLKVIGYDAEEELKFQNHDWLTIDFINKIRTLEKIILEDCYLSDEKDIQERLNKIKEVEIKK